MHGRWLPDKQTPQCEWWRSCTVNNAIEVCADVRPKESSIRHQTLQIIYSNSHAYAMFTSRT